MAQRRTSQLELCFDSMTDLITNLAGGLVLVVFLLLGMTQETRSVETKAEFKAIQKADAGGKPIHPLERQSQVLRQAISVIENDIDNLEKTKLPQLKKDVDDLLTRAAAAKQKK